MSVCLWANLGLAALIAHCRPSYFADVRLAPGPDAVHYLLLGHNLLLHGQFSRSAQPPYVPDMMRTPVYPVFVGVLDLLGGARAIYLVQVLLQTAGCLLLYLLVESLFGPRAAFWAALLFACDLALATTNFVPMSECLFLFLLMCSAVLILPACLPSTNARREVCWRIIIGGLALGAAILTRPVALYLPLVLAGYLVASGAFRNRLVWSVACALALLATSLGPVALWIGRNYAVCGLPRLTTVEAIDLVYQTGARIYEVRYGVSLDEARAMIAKEFGITPFRDAINDHDSGRPVVQIDAEMRSAAWRLLPRYPLELMVASTLGVVKASFSHAAADLAALAGRQWVAPGTANLLGDFPSALHRLGQNGPVFAGLFTWQLMHTVASLGLAACGIGGAILNRDKRAAGILCLLVLSYFYLTIAAGVGFEANWRFRLPAVAFLHAFAGCAVARLWQDRLQARGATVA